MATLQLIALKNAHCTMQQQQDLKNEGTLQKEEKEILPLATSLDMFPKNFLEVAWYLTTNASCGLDTKNVFKIRA
jgi:hypothetical protein